MIKNKLNNKQSGFTLVEVLVTIAVLGILSSIAIVGVQSVLNNGRVKYYKSLREMIIAAAKEYYSDNKDELPVDIDDSAYVYIKTLIEQKYLDNVEDANGDPCASKSNDSNNIVTVKKENAKEYSYKLSLKCPDPKMPVVENTTTTPNTANPICNLIENEKKHKVVRASLNGRTDYTYELMKQGKGETSFKTIRTKKGNLKTTTNYFDIDLNEGSGSYKVRINSGGMSTWCKDDKGNDVFVIETPEPSCEGLIYDINQVSKQWFKGDLSVGIKLKENNSTKYYIDHYVINLKKSAGSNTKGNNESVSFSGNGSKIFVGAGNSGRTGRFDLTVDIYNDVGDNETCALGTYYFDNTKPDCTNPKPNTTWTNRADAKVTVDCSDNDNSGKDQSGCKQQRYEDGTEGYSTNIQISDNVGNTNICTLVKMIDRTKPSCSEVSKRSKWTQTNFSYARCTDSLSGCTSATQYQTDYTQGLETNFTIRDNAGNTNTCKAEKKRDNTPPVCASKSSHTNWTKTGQAWATCSDTLSGCTNTGKYYGGTKDGKLEDVTIEDNAGNKTVCRNASKYRDNVAPSCGVFNIDPNTPIAYCTSRWTTTDNSTDPPTLVPHSGRHSYISSCSYTSTVTCADALSGCVKSTYLQKSGTTYGSGVSSCDGAGCCGLYIRDANCNNVSPVKSITIKDNAGNTSICTNTTVPSIPTLPDEPDDNTVPAACGAVKITPTDSGGYWINGDNLKNNPHDVAVEVTWDASTGITVDWPSTEGALTRVSSSHLHIGYGEGEWGKTPFTVRDKNNKTVKCDTPNLMIDITPPDGDYYYSIYNNSTPLCYNTKGIDVPAAPQMAAAGLVSVQPGGSSNRPSVIVADIRGDRATDATSGIASYAYEFLPIVHWYKPSNGASGNVSQAGGGSGDPCSGGTACNAYPASSFGAKSITPENSHIEQGLWNWGEDPGNAELWCFNYGIRMRIKDVAGNLFVSEGRGGGTNEWQYNPARMFAR